MRVVPWVFRGGGLTLSDKAARRQQSAIRDLFTRIARHYDVVNRVISLGQDRRWRRLALDAAELRPGIRILDVATGTGDLALMAKRGTPSAEVVGADLTMGMLRRAQVKVEEADVPWVLSDGLALSFAGESFDVVTSAFMMRNVPDVEQALREQVRVIRPGGRLVCLEITWPRSFPMNWLFTLYFSGVTPLLGSMMTGDRAAYAYLPQSVRRFMKPEALADMMHKVGLRQVSWTSMMMGTVAIHTGVRSIEAI
jgi:demethylmenaquinone methyltransferase/2-methoxy-6-polyprenyl-1,4-benzoquinol methylase